MDNKTLLTKILVIGIIFLFFDASVSAVLTDTKTPVINKSDKASIDEIVPKTTTGKAELRLIRSTFQTWPDILHKVTYFYFGANIINIGTEAFYGNIYYHVTIRPLTNPSKIIVEQDYSGVLSLHPWTIRTFFNKDWDYSKLFHDGDNRYYNSFIIRSEIYTDQEDDTTLWNKATEVGILVMYWGFSVFIFYI